MNTTSQLVDPFIPHRPAGHVPKKKALSGQYVTRWLGDSTVQSRPKALSTQRQHLAPIGIEQTLPETTGSAGQSTTLMKKRASFVVRLLHNLQIPFITIAAIVVGELAQSLIAGGVAIGVYAAFVFFKRVNSRTTYMLSLITLFTVIALYVVNPDTSAAPNYAIYTLLLTFIGVATTGRESRDV